MNNCDVFVGAKQSDVSNVAVQLCLLGLMLKARCVVWHTGPFCKPCGLSTNGGTILRLKLAAKSSSGYLSLYCTASAGPVRLVSMFDMLKSSDSIRDSTCSVSKETLPTNG